MNQATLQSELAPARQKLESGLDDLVQLRPMPAIALQIMKACREQKVKVTDLVRLVECDAAVSAKILSVVNSSLYGYSRDVTSINQAVVVLGFKSLSQLAVSVASEKVFSDGDSAVEHRLQLYEHSLGCAAVSRQLANVGKFAVDAGAAFLAGMLHDVGKLVFFDLAPKQYSDLQHEPRCDVKLERELFGIDHATVGAKFAEIWGLPDEIHRAIAGHHDEAQDEAADPPDPVLQVTSLANELAKTWGIGQAPEPTQCEFAATWLNDAGPAVFDELQSQASEQYGELKSLLTC